MTPAEPVPVADDRGWVLWAGTIGMERPVLERFPVAVATGFDHVSLSPLDVSRFPDWGVTADDVRRAAADHGLGLVMDPIMNWHRPSSPSRSRFGRFGRDEVLRMCEAVGAVSMSAVAFGDSADALADYPALFADLCDTAAGIGARVHLEFVPMTTVPGLAEGWDIVRAADRPNGGLLFDTWHFFRSGSSFDLLAGIPGERVFAVQVNDALAEVRGTLWEDTLNRELPGDGSFDLDRALGTLERIGGLRMVGPEVFSKRLDALPPMEAARLAGDRVRAAVARVARR